MPEGSSGNAGAGRPVAPRGRGAIALAGVVVALALLTGAWLQMVHPAPLLAGLPYALCAGLAAAFLARAVQGGRRAALRAPGRRAGGSASNAGDSGIGAAAGPGLLAEMYEKSPLAMLWCRDDGGLVHANPAFLALLGCTAQELHGKDYEALLAPEQRGAEQAAGLEADEGAPFAPYETEFINRDGMRVPVRVCGVRGTGADGTPLILRMVEDLSKRRRMVEALKHSESDGRMLSAVANNTRSMVMICDAHGRIEWVNQAFERVTGYTRHEAAGAHPGALLQGPATDPAAVARMRGSIIARQGFTAEVLNYAKGGRAYWVAMECAPVFDHAGRLERYVGIQRDITATRGMHEALTQSEQRFRDLTELSSDFFWELDAHLRFVQLTEIGPRADTRASRLGEHPWANPHSLLGAEAWARQRAVLESHQAFADFESPILACDGSILWRSLSGKPLFAADGSFIGYRGIGRDITARKESEEYIQESKRMYRRVVEGVRDIIFQTDAHGHLIYLNNAWSTATGFGVEEVIGEPIFDFVHPDEREPARRLLGDAGAQPGVITESVGRLRCKNGEYRWFEARLQSYADGDGDFITVGTLHDVTRERAALAQRRAAETALGEAQERYQRAMDAANDGMWERDLRSGRIYFSARFKQLLGFDEDEFPHDRRRLYGRIHPEDRAGFEAGMAEMMARRSRSVMEFRARCRDGQYRWFRLRSTVTCDGEGMPILTSGTLSDIDAAKQAEEELRRHRDDLAGLVEARTASAEAARVEAEAAREAAEAANRSKSDFLANMSHELRTPMHAILSFAGFGVERAAHAERGKLQHYFNHIQKSGGRLLILLNDLLDLSKLEAGKMELHLLPVDPAELLGDAIAEAEALAKSGDVRLRLQVPAFPVQAALDGPRVLQVIGNLLSNAIKFSPPGGEVLLSLAATQLRGALPGETRAALEIRVQDEGIGIPEGELEAVFDKFVQSSKTRTGAGGTGLGLAICREIAHAHGGEIQAHNNPRPARGACFVLRLPVRDEAAAGQAAGRAAA